jgi:redox-sensitive bicupin YhaK (pirin superfamily)
MPAQRGLTPSVEQQQFSTEDRHHRLLRILKPDGADGEGVRVHQDASMYVSRLDEGVSVEHTFGPDRVGYFYLISGSADVNGETLSTGDAAKVLSSGALRVTANATSEILIVDVPPA